jgi:hypothetical protein
MPIQTIEKGINNMGFIALREYIVADATHRRHEQVVTLIYCLRSVALPEH